MFTNKVYVLSLAAMAFISSCKEETKEEPQPSKPKTKLELLMSSNWLEVDARDANGSLWGQVAECVKDDLLKFKDAGVYEYNTGTVKCNANEPQIKPGNGTWELSADAGTLKMGPYSYRVEELTDSKLRLFMSGQGYQLTVFYEKR
ncbi:MAG TPA: lipocalin family protein [Bacteroidia bacterium]